MGFNLPMDKLFTAIFFPSYVILSLSLLFFLFIILFLFMIKIQKKPIKVTNANGHVLVNQRMTFSCNL